VSDAPSHALGYARPMNRRRFIGLLGSAAILPFGARAQQPMPVIGLLGVESHDADTPRFRAFHQGLGEIGYEEGRNVAIEYRWANGRVDQLSVMAGDLVRRQVNVIAALAGIPAARAANAATMAIPVVFQTGGDPVELGLVASLSRPGGNLTGTSTLNAEFGPKRLEVLHELLPAATVIALLVNPANPATEPQVREIEAAALTFGIRVHVLNATTERDFEGAFARVAELRAGALVIANSAPFTGRSGELGALATRYAVPTIFQNPEFAAAGGLVSYGSSVSDGYRLVGLTIGRILKGEKPADLPIQRANKVEMIINLKTAKALGINVPLPLLGRADEVIE
jgi:putative ABC transport system substrate-binding protein